MASSGGAAEEAVKMMKEVVSIIEKKKRNLEKRKNKLEEYKVKQPENLNDDQRLALSKYDEVVSSIDVLDEVYRLVSAHSKESCTQFESMIEQERERRISTEKEALSRSLSAFLCICNFANLPPSLQQSVTCLNTEQVSRLLAFHKHFLCSSNLPEQNLSSMHNICMALLSLHHQDQSLLPKTHLKTSLSDINRSLQLLLDSSLSRLLHSFPSLPAQQLDAFSHEQQPTKANFNFLHSSSVLASAEENAVLLMDTASKAQSAPAKETRTTKPARSTNGHAKTIRSAPRTNTTKQSKLVPTPLMDLTPKTTLSLENSKVLAEASGIDLSDLINNNNSTSNAAAVAPKTPKMPASSSAPSKKWSPKDDLLDDEKPLSVSPSNSFSDSLPSAVGTDFTQNGNKISHSQPLPNMGNIFDMILKNNPPVPDISQPSKLPYHRELPHMMQGMTLQGGTTNGVSQSQLFSNTQRPTTSASYVGMQQAQSGGYMATAPGLNYQSSSSVGSDLYSSHYGSSVGSEMPGRTQEEALNFVRQMLMMNGSGQQQHSSMHMSQAAVQRPSNLGAVGQQPPIGTGAGHHQQHSMMSGSRLAPTNTSNQTVYGSA